MVCALLDDEAARRHGFAHKLAEAVHRVVGVPGHVAEQFKRMTADGEAKQVGFRFQPFAVGIHQTLERITSRRIVDRPILRSRRGTHSDRRI